MGRGMTMFLVAGALAWCCQTVSGEDDPFGPPPPLPPEKVVPEIPKPPVVKPVPVVKASHRPVVDAAPTAAQQRVHERAAEAARQRKARIQQQKRTVPTPIAATFPTTGPLSHPALFTGDRGIPIAFRPIALAGLDPVPAPRAVRPTLRKTPRPPITKPPEVPAETCPQETK